MSELPLVAITATTHVAKDGRRIRVNEGYVRAIESVGLIPVLVPPLERESDADAIAARVAGIVVTGGVDVDPARYGQTRHATVDESDARRDATEIALVRAARERGIPLLGICRGCQVMNVAMGGTLVQDLPTALAGRAGALDHSQKQARDARVHEIRLESGSRLAESVGADRFMANSFHHQAPDAIGDGLRVVGRAPDGVIEGIESASPEWWAVGVQWHPEELTGSREEWDRSLFAAFAAAVREYAAAAAR